MDASLRREIKTLINTEFSTRNPKARIYDRIPQGQDGYDGELRYVAIGDRCWTFHRLNKRWWSRELGSPRIIRWGDVRVPVNSARVDPVQAPDWVSYKGGAVLAFDSGRQEKCSFVVQLPHGRVESSDIEPHVHWTVPNANSGNVVFRFTHSWASIHTAFPAETTDDVTVAVSGTADYHDLTSFTAMTGGTKGLSSMIICSFSRMGADASDTYASDIYLLEFDFHVPFDDHGSINQYTKELITIGR